MSTRLFGGYPPQTNSKKTNQPWLGNFRSVHFQGHTPCPLGKNHLLINRESKNGLRPSQMIPIYNHQPTRVYQLYPHTTVSHTHDD